MDAEQGLSGGDGGERPSHDGEFPVMNALLGGVAAATSPWGRWVWEHREQVGEPLRRIIKGASGAVVEPWVGSNDDLAVTKAEVKAEWREKRRKLLELNASSFNPAQVLAYDDGQGHLVPNWEGLGALGTGFATEWLNGVFGKRMMKPPGGEAIRFDPDTKGYYRGNIRLTEEEAQEIKARQGLVVGGKGQSVASEGKAGSISTWAEERSKSAPNDIIYAGDRDRYFYNGREITAEEAARVSREKSALKNVSVAVANPYRTEKGRLKVDSAIDRKKDPKSYAAEKEFKDILANQEDADRVYDSLSESKGGKILNPDIFREIYSGYRTKIGRIENTIATGAPASAAFRDRLWREIANPQGRRKLVFTAGGPGAGKTILVKKALAENADLIADSTLRDTRWAKDTIALAVKRGWDVEILYIQRPIEEVTMGVIQRADETGRWFPITRLSESHINAQRSVVDLSKYFENSPRVKISYLIKEGGKSVELNLGEIDEGGAWNYIEDYESGARSGMEGEGASRRKGGIGRSALKRGSAEAFRRIVRGKRLERGLLEKLARGDEEFQRLIEEVYGPKNRLSEEQMEKLPPLRREYVRKVESLWDEAIELLRQGSGEESVARHVFARRNRLKETYRSLTPPEMLSKIEKRNIEKYGNPNGPTIEWLRSSGKTWQQIIESACRSGGKDLGF